MKLIYNLSIFGSRTHTGLGRYSNNCVAGLAERFDLDLIARVGKLPRGNVRIFVISSNGVDTPAFCPNSSMRAGNAPYLLEVLSDAAQFLKPGNPQNWAEVINSLSDSFTTNNRLIEGHKSLPKFTWNNSVNALEHALLSVESHFEDSLQSAVYH